MRLALLLPLAYATDDHINKFLSRMGNDTLPPDSHVSTPALAEAWLQRGLTARDANAFEGAVRAQWRAAFHAPFLARSWRHLGNALLWSAAFDLSCEYANEARHAFSLAHFYLGDADAAKGLRALGAIGELRACFDDVELDRAEATALRALAALDADRGQASAAAEAVAAYCDDLRGVRVEARAFSPHIARRVYAALRICGVVSLGSLIDDETLTSVATLETATRESFEGSQDTAPAKKKNKSWLGSRTREAPQKQAGLAAAALSDPRVRGRGRNRFEVELPALELNASIIAHPVLHPLVGLVLGTAGVELDAVSSLVTYPGAELQELQADTIDVSKQADLPHLPPHGVIAIVPLVPSDPTKNGGAQFELGSHVSRLREVPLRTRPALANAGDAYVYDLRVRRGDLRHVASDPRPLLSLSYVKDWYVNAANQPSHHTTAFEAVNDTTLQGLLGRVDARRHHEDLFTVRGVCDVVV